MEQELTNPLTGKKQIGLSIDNKVFFLLKNGEDTNKENIFKPHFSRVRIAEEYLILSKEELEGKTPIEDRGQDWAWKFAELITI